MGPGIDPATQAHALNQESNPRPIALWANALTTAISQDNPLTFNHFMTSHNTRRAPCRAPLPARSALHSGRSGGHSSGPPEADNKEALERLLGGSSGVQRDASLRNRSLPSPTK